MRFHLMFIPGLVSSQGDVPAESDHHVSTIMTWPTTDSVDAFNITATRHDIASIARAIARHEPVDLFVNTDDETSSSSVQELLGREPQITIHNTTDIDSLWARDTGPVFVHRNPDGDGSEPIGPGGAAGVVLNFDEWGGKNEATPDEDATPAMLAALHVPELEPRTTLQVEGGALEFDGAGGLLATESSVLNDNRNPGWTRAAVEAELTRLFAVDRFVWLAGLAGADITDMHVGAVARFAAPGVVLLHRPHASHTPEDKQVYDDARARLANATDRHGLPLQVVEIEGPDLARTALDDSSLLSYLNFYVGNSFVALPAFGDKEKDRAARDVIEMQFPGRVVEQVRADEMARQGGGIHCATQQVIDSGNGCCRACSDRALDNDLGDGDS